MAVVSGHMVGNWHNIPPCLYGQACTCLTGSYDQISHISLHSYLWQTKFLKDCICSERVMSRLVYIPVVFLVGWYPLGSMVLWCSALKNESHYEANLVVWFLKMLSLSQPLVPPVMMTKLASWQLLVLRIHCAYTHSLLSLCVLKTVGMTVFCTSHDG